MSAGHHQVIRCRSGEPTSPRCELRFSMCFNREHAIACKVRNGDARDAPSPVITGCWNPCPAMAIKGATFKAGD